MGGGKRSMFSFFGTKKQNHRGHDAAVEPRQLRNKGHDPERNTRLLTRGREEKMEPRYQRRIRPSDEDRKGWVAEPGIDQKAEEFIEKHHRRLFPEENH